MSCVNVVMAVDDCEWSAASALSSHRSRSLRIQSLQEYRHIPMQKTVRLPRPPQVELNLRGIDRGHISVTEKMAEAAQGVQKEKRLSGQRSRTHAGDGLSHALEER